MKKRQKVKLILVRHGESNGNADGRVCGRRDISLSTTGRCQAKLVGIRLNRYVIDLIISSPLIRAECTANEIAVKQDIKPQILLDNELIEMSFGVAEGYTNDEYQQKFLKELCNSQLGYPTDIEGQETFLEVQKRYKEAIEKSLYKYQNKLDTICFVGHGMGIGAFLAYVKGVSDKEFNSIKFPRNTAITVLEYYFDTKEYKILVDTDASHVGQ